MVVTNLQKIIQKLPTNFRTKETRERAGKVHGKNRVVDKNRFLVLHKAVKNVFVTESNRCTATLRILACSCINKQSCTENATEHFLLLSEGSELVTHVVCKQTDSPQNRLRNIMFRKPAIMILMQHAINWYNKSRRLASFYSKSVLNSKFDREVRLSYVAWLTQILGYTPACSRYRCLFQNSISMAIQNSYWKQFFTDVLPHSQKSFFEASGAKSTLTFLSQNCCFNDANPSDRSDTTVGRIKIPC